MSLASVGKGDTNAHLRPTSDRVRESLFNLLLGGRFGDPFTGTQVLDLFAGTGALGLEALSRGAKHVTFVDSGAKANALILANVAKCRAESNIDLIRRDAARLGPNRSSANDLVFLDPPYGSSVGETALTACYQGGWIAEDALIIWEDSRPQTPPSGFDLIETRRYGDTFITLLRANGTS